MTKASTRSKARSRLKSSHTEAVSEHTSSPQRSRSARSGYDGETRIIRYIRHFPLLVFSLPGYGICYWILNSVYPEDIAHWLIPNSYLAIQAPFFLSNVFLWSYVFLNTRQGIVMSVLSSLLLFLRLQQVIFEITWIMPVVVVTATLLFLFKNGHTAQSA